MKTEEKSRNKEKLALIIRKYQQYLRLEKALSPNTLDAYLTDLEKLLHFLEGEEIDILDVTLDDLQRFSAGLHDIGIHPRSQARILSGIKSFFHFLVLADYLEGDPSELLESPKIGFKLPEVLSKVIQANYLKVPKSDLSYQKFSPWQKSTRSFPQ